MYPRTCPSVGHQRIQTLPCMFHTGKDMSFIVPCNYLMCCFRFKNHKHVLTCFKLERLQFLASKGFNSCKHVLPISVQHFLAYGILVMLHQDVAASTLYTHHSISCMIYLFVHHKHISGHVIVSTFVTFFA